MDRWRMGIVALIAADTGATLTCVDRALADSLGLPEARGQLGMGMGIPGDAGSMGVDARGLLGLNFLRSFRLTLDFDAERLTLAEPSRR